MSDILSPFLVVFPKSDALAYMCFSALMNNIRQNFLEGQPGIHTSIQHIGSLLQRVDKKLWRQIGNDSFALHCSVNMPCQVGLESTSLASQKGDLTGSGCLKRPGLIALQAQLSMSTKVVKQSVMVFCMAVHARKLLLGILIPGRNLSSYHTMLRHSDCFHGL